MNTCPNCGRTTEHSACTSSNISDGLFVTEKKSGVASLTQEQLMEITCKSIEDQQKVMEIEEWVKEFEEKAKENGWYFVTDENMKCLDDLRGIKSFISSLLKKEREKGVRVVWTGDERVREEAVREAKNKFLKAIIDNNHSIGNEAMVALRKTIGGL
jgi:hypothetical protein